MKLLVMDNSGEGCGLDLALRAQDADHEVRYWLPPFKTGKPRPYGDRMVDKPVDWKPAIEWADLTVLTGNDDFMGELSEYFGKGYPIFGCNAKGAKLEVDREHGQEVLKKAGIQTLPYQIVSSAREAVELITRTQMAYAIKPWGGESDKSLTYVACSPDDAIFTILRWEKEGKLKGQLMFQEKVEGVEIGISGMFGPGGWCRWLEESFEHKKFMNDDLGENTGEQGTVIRHVLRSRLFDEVLDPLTDHLHSINYVGDCNVNCMVDSAGSIWPFEFTCRLGWPDFCIRQAVIEDDPVEWMVDLVNGVDSFKCSPEIVVGVCITHGDFPRGGPADFRPKDPLGTWVGYPIYGVTNANYPNIHWQQAMDGKVPMLIGDQVENTLMHLTAGNYPCVVTGCGKTVEAARKAAYDIAWELKIPSNTMFRTDIGRRLMRDLPKLHEHGFALGMRYSNG